MKGVIYDGFANFVSHYMTLLFGNGLLVVLIQCTHNEKNMKKYGCEL